MNTHLLEQAQKLPVEEQLELVGALWDSIAEHGAIPLSQKQKEERNYSAYPTGNGEGGLF